jgi:prepilin-type N-terminal cleavage/methylation domain-containing protein
MRQAFTLIEVLLAAAILSLVVVAVMPLWSDLHRAPQTLPLQAAAWDALRQVSALQIAAAADGEVLVVASGGGSFAISIHPLPSDPPSRGTAIPVRLVRLDARRGEEPQVLASAVRMLSPPAADVRQP